MGAPLSKEEKPAVDAFQRHILQKIDTQSENSMIEINLIKRKLLKDRILKDYLPGDVICKEQDMVAPFILLSGRIRVGQYYKSRKNSFHCVEGFYGIGSMHEIVVEDLSKILILGRCNFIQYDIEFHLVVRLAPIFPMTAIVA